MGAPPRCQRPRELHAQLLAGNAVHAVGFGQGGLFQLQAAELKVDVIALALGARQLDEGLPVAVAHEHHADRRGDGAGQQDDQQQPAHASAPRFLCHAQHGAAGTRVGGQLFVGGLDGAADQVQRRHERNRLGQPAVGRRRLGRAVHVLLDDAVFQRVEADHRQAATGLERSTAASSPASIGQLAVDVDADGLEAARGRVDLVLPTRHHRGDQLGQFGGAGERLLLAAGHDGAGDAAALALFAVGPQHISDLALFDAVDPLRRFHCCPDPCACPAGRPCRS
jgi:hypothetical protein